MTHHPTNPPETTSDGPLEQVSDLCRLDTIQPDRCGIVRSVRAGDAEVDRLKSMGVCVGRKVMMIRPGDPMIVRVLGSRIGISARLAHSVFVQPCGGDYFGRA